MYLCICNGVTEQDVIDLVNSTHSAFVFATICQHIKDNGCCKCLARTREVIDETNRAKARKASYDRVRGTPAIHVGSAS